MFLCFVEAVGAVCCNNIEGHVNKMYRENAESLNLSTGGHVWQ